RSGARRRRLRARDREGRALRLGQGPAQGREGPQGLPRRGLTTSTGRLLLLRTKGQGPGAFGSVAGLPRPCTFSTRPSRALYQRPTLDLSSKGGQRGVEGPV